MDGNVLNPLHWLVLPLADNGLGQGDRVFGLKLWLATILVVGLPLGPQPGLAQDIAPQDIAPQDTMAQNTQAPTFWSQAFTVDPSPALEGLTFDHPPLQRSQVDFFVAESPPFDHALTTSPPERLQTQGCSLVEKEYGLYGFWPPNPQLWGLQIPPELGGGGAKSHRGLFSHDHETAPPEQLQTGGHQPAIAQQSALDLDLDPAIIEGSPVLQRWLQGPPDITHEIRHQPSFRPRLRVGYAHFPSTDGIGGIALGVDDLFVWPGTGLTLSGSYSRGGGGRRQDYGAEARYYLLPLGGYVNLAPTVGYRALTTPAYNTDGISLGLRLMLVPSRGGAADLAISHQWVAVGGDREVGVTQFSLGYAVTRQLRLGTDLQFQNSQFGQDSRLGLSLEWLL